MDDVPPAHPVVADGAYGTLLHAHVRTRELVDVLNLREPERVIAAHLDYLTAGARRIQTNTFLAFTRPGRERRDLYRGGIDCALEAGSSFGGNDPVAIAATIGPASREARHFWPDIECVLDHGGADLVLCETVTELPQALAFLEAWHDVAQGVDTRAALTVSVDPGAAEDDGMPRWAWLAKVRDVGDDVSVGVNCCTGPEPALREVVQRLAEREVPITVQPSAGLPRDDGSYPWADPEAWAEAVAALVADLPVGTVGGCCGTTPAHVEALVAAFHGGSAPG
jgi:methionine synthase I (cobalamin-dependent)